MVHPVSKFTGSAANMDVARLSSYIASLRNTLAAKVAQQRGYFERQLARKGGHPIATLGERLSAGGGLASLTCYRMCQRADGRWRVTEAVAEGAIEVRHVAEAGIVGDSAYLLGMMTWVAKQAVREGEPPLEHILRKARALLFEESLDVTRRAAVPQGQPRDREVRSPEVFTNVALYCVQLRGSHTARTG
jgi:hypothetical protein